MRLNLQCYFIKIWCIKNCLPFLMRFAWNYLPSKELYIFHLFILICFISNQFKSNQVESKQCKKNENIFLQLLLGCVQRKTNNFYRIFLFISEYSLSFGFFYFKFQFFCFFYFYIFISLLTCFFKKLFKNRIIAVDMLRKNLTVE